MYVDDCVYDCSGRHAHGSALIKQVVRLRMLLNGSVRSSSANYQCFLLPSDALRKQSLCYRLLFKRKWSKQKWRYKESWRGTSQL